MRSVLQSSMCLVRDKCIRGVSESRERQLLAVDFLPKLMAFPSLPCPVRQPGAPPAIAGHAVNFVGSCSSPAAICCSSLTEARYQGGWKRGSRAEVEHADFLFKVRALRSETQGERNRSGEHMPRRPTYELAKKAEQCVTSRQEGGDRLRTERNILLQRHCEKKRSQAEVPLPKVCTNLLLE